MSSMSSLVHLQVRGNYYIAKCQGRKVSKTFDQNLADTLAASDKGSCFEQEKLLALDREDI